MKVDQRLLGAWACTCPRLILLAAMLMFRDFPAQATEPPKPSPPLSPPTSAPAAPSSPLPAATSPPPAPAASNAATMLVQRFDVVGNTLIPAATVQDRLREFLGAATLQQLRNAAAAVQELYGDAGYGGVVAFLPEQTPRGGVVRIRVVEGKLTRIEITGNQQFSDDNVRASVPALLPGVTPQVRLIDAQIQIANENPAKQVQVLLQPGTEPGSVAARVRVTEQPVQRISARADNTGTASTGRWRAALGWQHGNLWDADHALSVELQTSPEHPSAVLVTSAGYRAPLYSRAMAIDAYGALSDVDSGRIASPAGDVLFSGRGGVVGVRGSAYLPRLQNVDHRAALGLEWREFRNACAVDGLSAGACGAAGNSVSLQPLGLSYAAQTVSERRLGGSVSLYTNLALGGAHGRQEDFEAVRSGSQRRYTVLRGSAYAAQPLGELGEFSARMATQYARQPLVPGEQFGLGGALSVRGFEERELTGDSGVQLSLEWMSPNVAETWLGVAQADFRGTVFADVGYISKRHGDPCLGMRSECHMGSLGVGMRGQWRQLQLRLDLARAMTVANATRKGDSRLHAALTFNF